MTTQALRKLVTEFRAGILGKRPSKWNCAVVCYPLSGYLEALGVPNDLHHADFGYINHVWLELKDGRMVDPTADQFGLAPVYIARRVPAVYKRLMANKSMGRPS